MDTAQILKEALIDTRMEKTGLPLVHVAKILFEVFDEEELKTIIKVLKSLKQ